MNCKLCKKKFYGRSDKIFCSIKCKSTYHILLAEATNKATQEIDKILHRNRSILLEILGKKKSKIKVHKEVLDQKKFNYTYVTAYHLNTNNKMVNILYDFSWSIFSDQEILITRLRNK